MLPGCEHQYDDGESVRQHEEKRRGQMRARSLQTQLKGHDAAEQIGAQQGAWQYN